MSHIDVILEDLSKNPQCPHGPTILFARTSDDSQFKFYACSAYRDRKGCPFYLSECELSKVSEVKRKKWLTNRDKFIQGVNHRKLYVTFNQVLQQAKNLRQYCKTCSLFVERKYEDKHASHDVVENLDEEVMAFPSKFLEPLENPKSEAQFLFSEKTISNIMSMLQGQGFKKVICMGAPRIHEFIQKNCDDMSSLLLDIDRRYLSFFGPLQFCWYNMFNHHFFLPDSEEVFQDFLQSSDKDVILLTDPPFGCRVELLSHTVQQVDKLYKKINKTEDDLPIFWFFPYFMEPQILNSLPKFAMLDYKVDYDNHALFQDGPKGRKMGSPVRIFTNVDPSLVKLPEIEGYKFCTSCKRWVSSENQHCSQCNSCTSKDGRTYTHCKLCKRCVKPTWVHCATCKRCAQSDHKCQELGFAQACFHCKKPGHKKRECPSVNQEELQMKRKKGEKTKGKKRSAVVDHEEVQMKRKKVEKTEKGKAESPRVGNTKFQDKKKGWKNKAKKLKKSN